MQGILTHPWFTSKPFRNGTTYAPTPLSPVAAAIPLPSADAIDTEIMENLVLLGWGAEVEVEHALLSKE